MATLPPDGYKGTYDFTKRVKLVLKQAVTIGSNTYPAGTHGSLPKTVWEDPECNWSDMWEEYKDEPSIT